MKTTKIEWTEEEQKKRKVTNFLYRLSLQGKIKSYQAFFRKQFRHF